MNLDANILGLHIHSLIAAYCLGGINSLGYTALVWAIIIFLVVTFKK